VHGERGVAGRRLTSHRVLRRASWGVADQGLSSLTNFALGIFVARSATTAGFGAFSIVFTTFTVTLGLSRALTSEPLVVRCSDRSEPEWRQGTVAATGTALAVGIALGLGCGLVGWTVGGTLAAPFLALGATLPGLLLQDCWRYAFFANGEGRKAFLNDALCGAVLVVLFGVLLRSGVASIGLLVLAWGGAATVGALAGALQSGVVPVPQQARAWATRHRDLIPRYLGEFVASSGAGQLSVYGVGLIGGLATLGSFRAGYLLFGPLQVLFMGIGLVAVPELVRFLRRSPRHLYLASSGLSVLLATVALAWGMVVIPMPASVGRAILGSTWSTAHALALALTIGCERIRHHSRNRGGHPSTGRSETGPNGAGCGLASGCFRSTHWGGARRSARCCVGTGARCLYRVCVLAGAIESCSGRARHSSRCGAAGCRLLRGAPTPGRRRMLTFRQNPDAQAQAAAADVALENVSRYQYPRLRVFPAEERIFGDLLRPGMQVLDLGCGSGRILRALALHSVNVCACDLNYAALEQLRSSYADDDLTGIEQADARSLPFRTESFDVVIFAFNGIDFLYRSRSASSPFARSAECCAAADTSSCPLTIRWARCCRHAGSGQPSRGAGGSVTRSPEQCDGRISEIMMGYDCITPCRSALPSR
jgi:hypothetical protein